MNYIMMIETNPSEEEISWIMNGNIRVPPTREVSTEESISSIEHYLKLDKEDQTNADLSISSTQTE